MNYRWFFAASKPFSTVHAVTPRKRKAACGVTVSRSRGRGAVTVMFCPDCNRLIAKEKK